MNDAVSPDQDRTPPEAPFEVPPASTLRERRPRTLKYGECFALFDSCGDAQPGDGSAEGLYYRDTRHVSNLVLIVEEARPVLLSSAISDDNGTLTVDLSNPDLNDAAGKRVLDHDLLHLRRSRFLFRGGCYERLALTNFDRAPRRLRVTLLFASDFADLFEVRGTPRSRHGTMHAPDLGRDKVILSYTGLDSTRRETCYRFDPVPASIAAGHTTWVLDLPAGGQQVLFFEIRCGPLVDEGPDLAILPVRRAFFTAMGAARRALRGIASRVASVASSNAQFNEAARRCVADLAMLVTQTPQGPYPFAGIPWFSTVFGRDGLITALQTLWADPSVARGVLLHLAENQATQYDPAADAEPGKILHEVRYGEMAETSEVPFRRYYGSIDSTPLFVMLAGAYLERTDDMATMASLWPHIEAALGWIDIDGDTDGDGFVEYGRKADNGLANQGWKDSHDSIFHADGSMAQGPIALVEVQAYVYGAWMAAASIARRLGRDARADALGLRAAALRERFDAAFFDAALGTYVLALDGDKKPCRVRTSNAGHALLTGVARPDRAAAVVASLMSGASFSGWGVRTVASTESRYNPMSYHNGSVWPHDNALIAAGFARYGFRTESARIFEGLFAASTYIDLKRLPELFCGFARQRTRGPTFYPVACSPQAWAAVAPLSLMQSSLGLGFDPAGRRITFDRPGLPPFLDDVTLRNVALGEARCDVSLRRGSTGVVVDILRREGEVAVMTAG